MELKILREYIENGVKVTEFTKDGKTVSNIMKVRIADKVQNFVERYKEHEQISVEAQTNVDQNQQENKAEQQEQTETENYTTWRLRQMEDKINYTFYKLKGVIK